MSIPFNLANNGNVNIFVSASAKLEGATAQVFYQVLLDGNAIPGNQMGTQDLNSAGQPVIAGNAIDLQVGALAGPHDVSVEWRIGTPSDTQVATIDPPNEPTHPGVPGTHGSLLLESCDGITGA